MEKTTEGLAEGMEPARIEIRQRMIRFLAAQA
jgi:hypothetical protein